MTLGRDKKTLEGALRLSKGEQREQRGEKGEKNGR